MLDWRSEIIGLLHANKIKQKELAKELGVSDIWVCSVLSGNKNSSGMEQRMRDAINKICERRM